MQGEPQAVTGRFEPGMNSRKRKQLKVAAKLNELTTEFFPVGGCTRMDAARLKLAAQHFVDAEICRDPVTRQRATRCGEYLLGKLSVPSASRPMAQTAEALATARELLERLSKGNPDAV
jgi:hypothetical protein